MFEFTHNVLVKRRVRSTRPVSAANVLERFVMFAASTEHNIETVFQNHTTPTNATRKTKMSNATLNSHIVSCFRFAKAIPSRARYTGHEMTKIYAQP